MNIPEAVSSLVAAGFSQKAIAKKIGSSQSTVNRALHGKDIRFSTGRLIIELAESATAAGPADDDEILAPVSPVRQGADSAGNSSSAPVSTV